MSKYNRYSLIKKIYPDYVVIILSKNHLITYNFDLDIIKLVGINKLDNLKINYIIVDELDLDIKKFIDNNYFYYFKMILVKKVIDYIYNDYL